MEFVGNNLIIPCSLSGTNITTVGATEDNGLILIPDGQYGNEELRIKFEPVTDMIHTHTFSCHGYGSDGIRFYFNFTIAAISGSLLSLSSLSLSLSLSSLSLSFISLQSLSHFKFSPLSL